MIFSSIKHQKDVCKCVNTHSHFASFMAANTMLQLCLSFQKTTVSVLSFLDAYNSYDHHDGIAPGFFNGLAMI